MTRVLALPLLVVAVLYGLVGPSPILAAALSLLVLVPLLARARVALGTAAQALLLLSLWLGALLALGSALPRHAGPDELRPLWAAFAGATLLIAALRGFLAAPLGGPTLTLALGLAALAACGGCTAERAYAAGVVAFVVAAFAARRAADPTHAPFAALRSRYLAPVGTALFAAGAFCAASLVTLPWLHDWAVRKMSLTGTPMTGFSERMWLGSMRGMLQSDEVVMRVRGQSIDYLRGVVLDRYRRGVWSQSDEDSTRPTEPPRVLPAGPGTTEIELCDPDPQRYFLPLDSAEVALPSGVARVDRFGILSALASDPSRRVELRVAGSPLYPVAPAAASDLALPNDIAAQLEQLALEWTHGARSPSERLAAIEARLQRDYRYSLELDRPIGREPLLHFLLEGREGHCEYFASALALLGRAAGVPTRVVSGYRVVERSPVGDYRIVRQRHAHSWVEAWLPDPSGRASGWRTFDATPPEDLAASGETPFGPALLDLLASGYNGVLVWLDERTPAEMVTPPIALVVLALLLRWLRRLRLRPRRRGASEAPPPSFRALSQALAGRGMARAPSEPIERLAARLDRGALGSAEVQRLRALLLRYCDWRYGAHDDDGEWRALERELLRETASLNGSGR